MKCTTMKRKRWFADASAFQKLSVTFLLIVLPLLLIGFIILMLSSMRMKEEIRRSALIQTQNGLSSLSNDMNRIQRAALDLLQDDDAEQLAKAPELYSPYEKTAAILRVQQRLTALKSSSQLIDTVRILFPDLERSINATGFPGGSYTEILPGDIPKPGIHPASPLGITFQGGRLFLPIFSYDPISNTSFFVVEVVFSKTALQSIISQITNFPNASSALLFPSLGFSVGNFPKGTVLPNGADPVSSMLVGGIHYTIFLASSEALGVTICEGLRTDDLFPPMDQLTLLMILFCLIVLVCIAFFFRVANRVVNRPLVQMVHAFRQVEQGNFSIQLKPLDGNDFGYLYSSFNRMTVRLDDLIQKVYQQQILLQKAELKQLQAQINPHFLYNSYFFLHRLIKRDPESATLFSKKMGIYFRYITRNGDDYATLADENRHCRIYAEMQSARFEGRIRVDYGKLPESKSRLLVPRLILQPLLENAFKYGLEDKVADGLLRVSFHEQPQGLTVCVEDNGDVLRDEELRKMKLQLEGTEKGNVTEMTGLSNIHRRLQIAFPKGGGLRLSRSALGGLRAELFFPVES